MKFEYLAPDLLKFLHNKNVLFLISEDLQSDFITLKNFHKGYKWNWESIDFSHYPRYFEGYDFIIIHPNYKHRKIAEKSLGKYYLFQL